MSWFTLALLLLVALGLALLCLVGLGLAAWLIVAWAALALEVI